MSTNALDSFSADRLLTESIAIATRSIHTKLNKLIIARLPLILPPQAPDPSVYASGLLHIAPIYKAFESSWQNLLDASASEQTAESKNNIREATQVPDRLCPILQSLRLPGLMRSHQLVADIQSLTGWSEHVVEEQMDMITRTGHLAQFISHIKRAINNKPHVLLAYSYILFMALFSGGRFIRATLESAGEEFWNETASPIKPTLRPCEVEDKPRDEATRKQTELHQPARRLQLSHNMPLRFFHFDTPFDGEDLKRDFKEKLAKADELLAIREKQDIVQESICIFENMMLVVAQLDKTMARSAEEPVDSPISISSLATVIRNPLAGRFRDSLVVTKERSARGSSNRHSDISMDEPDGARGASSDLEQGQDAPLMAQTKVEPQTPEGHPAVSSLHGIELCPAFPKSVQFEKLLPQPTRGPVSLASATSDITESLKVASKRIKREQVANWVFAIAIGVILTGAVFSGRRHATDIQPR